MTPSGASRNRIEERLNQGLLGQWYPVTKSVQVRAGDKPLGVTLAGEPIVLWRDEAGALHALEDFCPHRGARLSRGVVHDGNISCGYHGVTLDGTGTIVRVPAMPECALEGRKAVRAYEVREGMDAVFVYLPSAERPTAPELALPPEFANPDWTGFLCTSNWACNYRYALDNLADPMHGCYLHADSFMLAYGAKQDLMKLDRTENGFLVSRVHQQGENFDWTEMVVEDGQMYCRLDIPYPAAAGPGGPLRIIGYVTPIDETHCKVFFWRLREVGAGTTRESYRFLYRAALEERHWKVLEQDREMLVAMPDDAREREMLYQHDIGVSRLRQMMARAAKSQIAAEEAPTARAAV